VSELLKTKLPYEKKWPIGILKKKIALQILAPDCVRQSPFISDQRARS
jgi:hypothetical protein